MLLPQPSEKAEEEELHDARSAMVRRDMEVPWTQYTGSVSDAK